MLNIKYLGVIIGFMLLLTGCATSRDTVSLDASVATTASSSTVSNGKSVYIKTVVDERGFEAKPKDPSIPSLDPSEADNSDIRSRALARKRNGFGKALGDIMLPEGSSVADLVKKTLESSFSQKGYAVVTKGEDIKPDTAIVDVKIKQMWSWMNPGFWAISISSEISTDVKIKKQDDTPVLDKNIHVKEVGNFQTGMADNWKTIMEQALHSYMQQVGDLI